jgi:hypothetical protein
VITGDIHAFGVGELQAEEGGATIGTEFVGGSISSMFPVDLAGVVQESVSGLPRSGSPTPPPTATACSSSPPTNAGAACAA